MAVRRFFQWLETKSYKMHVRVLLGEVPELHAVSRVQWRAAQGRSVLWRLAAHDGRVPASTSTN